MIIRDYNGTGKWTEAAILDRYSQYCRELKISQPLDLRGTCSTKGEITWIYPALEKVIFGIEAGDEACIQIGIELIEEDGGMPFGRIHKSNTARALRRSKLRPHQEERLRKRIVSMLMAHNVPHEFNQYAKLLRKIGLGEFKDQIIQLNPTTYSMDRWLKYFKNSC